eukprot:XP_001696701.1 predicted protein [Chlamydomonas reinhardtii]
MDAVAAKNASNWLRLAFHALTCPDGQACPIKELCVVGKSVLKQICLAEQDISTPTRPTSSVRKLLLHWLRCEEAAGYLRYLLHCLVVRSLTPDRGCAVCSHTCELFRRGLAVQPEHFPPAPAPQLVEGGALDALVEQSLARSEPKIAV